MKVNIKKETLEKIQIATFILGLIAVGLLIWGIIRLLLS